MQNALHTGEIHPKQISLSNFIFRRRPLITDIISALFILLFLYTALSKTLQINSTVEVLKKSPILSNLAETIAWLVVIIEYIISALLFFPGTRKAGLYSSFQLMIVFTLYIGYMMTFAPKLPCSCGGVISKMNWTQHLVFNIVFILLALSTILLYRERSKLKEEEMRKL